MTKRPHRHDASLIETSAREWTEKNASIHPDLVGDKDSDRTWFTQRLAAAAVRAVHMDASEIADSLAKAMHERVDEELLDAMDGFVSLHERLLRQAVVTWAKGWGPKAPFEDYARIEARGHRGGGESGIGLITARYRETAEFLFLPDKDREASIRGDGYISRWNILRWEDVERTLPLEPSDVALMTSHREAEAVLEAGYAAANLKQKARDRLSALVKSHEKMPMADAMAVYDALAGSPEEAARVIMALNRAAAHVLHETADRESPAPGMLL